MTQLLALNVEKFRNLSSVCLEPNSRFNLLYGDNASGKTSLLEAIYLLSTNRSFRTQNLQYLIQHDMSALSVFARLAQPRSSMLVDSGIFLTQKLGISRDRSRKTIIRLDGEAVKQSSDLAKALPCIAIDPASFELLDGSPANRRALLDWLVFHVKPEFLEDWKNYQRCLKQRNILLRSGKISRSDLLYWDKLLVPAARRVERFRYEVLGDLQGTLTDVFKDQKQELAVSLKYKSGWASARILNDVGTTPNLLEEAWYHQRLDESFEQDLKSGFSQLGSHKHDIRIKTELGLVSELFSRGQKKTLILSLYLCVARLLRLRENKQPVFLLDDLPSELDTQHLEWLCGQLDELGSQVFITAVDPQPLIALELFDRDTTQRTVFHVKHGAITNEN